ncbi:MAG: peptidylprolyl isomerase [Cyanobacteria bacterium P01_F01_bin.116]
MNTALQLDTQALSKMDLVPLLRRYQLLPQLQRDLIIDQAIASIQLTSDDIRTACQQFDMRYSLFSVEDQHSFCRQRGLVPDELEALAIRQFKVQRFKQDKWEHKVGALYSKRKHDFDQVIYSLIRTRDSSLAQDIYFRIQKNEDTFANLAKIYSKGSSAEVGGLVGPVSLMQPHRAIARLLSVSQVGQLWFPIPIGEWFVILRLEERRSAELNDTLKQRLLDECFETWITVQMQSMA